MDFFHIQMFVLACFVVSSVAAHRAYLPTLPNFARVPCAGDGRCCLGAEICVAFGHDGCCPIGGLNSFGIAVSERKVDRGGNLVVQWGVELAMSDPDEDGLSNGDELGDPCAEYAGEGTERETYSISHPGVKHSQGNRASCTFQLPQTPALNGSFTSDSKSFVIWGMGTDRFADCWCDRRISVNGLSIDQRYSTLWQARDAKPDPSFPALDALRICEGEIDKIVVQVSNLKGGTESNVSTVLNSEKADSLSRVLPCAKLSALPEHETNTQEFSSPKPPNPALLAGGIGAFGLFILLIITKLQQVCMGRTIPRASSAGGVSVAIYSVGCPSCIPWLMAPGFLRHCIPRPVRRCLRIRGTGSACGFLAVLWTICVCAVAGLVTSRAWIERMYPAENRALVARVLGVTALALLLVSALSSMKVIGGLCLRLPSPDRVLVLHRWMGTFLALVVLAHAIWMAYDTVTKSEYSLDRILSWNDLRSVNGGAGLAAGSVIFVIAISSQLRRWSYALFWILHVVSLPTLLIFVYLHIQDTVIRGKEATLFVLTMVFVDAALAYIFPLMLLRSRVLETKVVVEGPRGVTRVRIERSIRCCHPILQLFWSPVKPGGYVHIFAPNISLLSHPFTAISASSPSATARSVEAGTRSGDPSRIAAKKCGFEVFEVLVRAETHSSRSWTGSLQRASSLASDSGIASTTLCSDSNKVHSLSSTRVPRLLHPIVVFSPWGEQVAAVHKKYSNVLFIAGGIGVTPAMGLVRERLFMQRSGVACRSSLVWVCREYGLASHVIADLESLCAPHELTHETPLESRVSLSASLLRLNNPSLQVQLHITHSDRDVLPPVQSTRPNISLILDKEAEDAVSFPPSTSPTTVLVYVVGPPSLEEEVIDAVWRWHDEGGGVEFHVVNEAFLW